MEHLQQLFATAHQNLLGKAKKHNPGKAEKKKSTDRQTEFQTKSEPSPSEADIAASQEEVANPTKHAKAQEVIKAAVDEFFEPAKAEYDTLYDFISKISPGTIKKLKPALDRSEHLAFGEPTVELALGDEFTVEQEKTFQTISKATRYLVALLGKILGKYLERDEKSSPPDKEVVLFDQALVSMEQVGDAAVKLNYLWLDPRARGQGLGHRVLSLIERLADQHCCDVWLMAQSFQLPDQYSRDLDTNEGENLVETDQLVRLYRAHGFQGPANRMLREPRCRARA